MQQITCLSYTLDAFSRLVSELQSSNCWLIGNASHSNGIVLSIIHYNVFFFFFSQDSHQLSSCPPGYSGYRVRSVYCAQRLLQAHLCSSSRRHDRSNVMQIADRWKCRLGWGSCLGCLFGCNRLGALLRSNVSTWSQVETNQSQAEGDSDIQIFVYLVLFLENELLG